MIATRAESTDRDLVEAVRAGDDCAFEELYRRYQPRIAAFVRRKVGDPARAEDIAQDVFFSALRRLRATDAEIDFKPWVFQIASNAAIDHWRRTSRAEEISVDADEGMRQSDRVRLTGAAGPGSGLVDKERFAHLRGGGRQARSRAAGAARASLSCLPAPRPRARRRPAAAPVRPEQQGSGVPPAAAGAAPGWRRWARRAVGSAAGRRPGWRGRGGARRGARRGGRDRGGWRDRDRRRRRVRRRPRGRADTRGRPARNGFRQGGGYEPLPGRAQ